MSKRGKPKLGLIVMAVLVGYFLYIIAGQEQMLSAKRNEVKKLEASVQEEMRLNEELQNEKSKVNSDEYVEKIAREKLGMVKSGEKVFVDVNR